MEPSQNVYDKQNTLLALNMAVVAVKTIVSSEDRIVLEQQYRTIIDRLKFGNINDDKELKDFHDDLLKGITNSLLAQDERRRFEQVYDREQKRAVLSALKGTLSALPLPGELPWLALGKTLMRGATAFFGYRAVKKRLSEELSDDLWRLEREKVRGIDALQRSLLNTSWTLLRKYGFSDDERVTQENLDELEKALLQPDPVRARRMFADLAGKFKAYPPFWFYYGEAALQSCDVLTAENCFARFDETNRDVLFKDPYRIQMAKYRLMMSSNPTCDFVRRHLAIVAEDDTQWLNNLYRGVVAFAIGDKDEGIRAVEHNIDFDYEKEISSLVLKAMTLGTQHLWAALARVFYDGKGVEVSKVAAYKYACLARLYGDNSVNDLIKQIEGSGGWFGPKAELSAAEMNAARAEAQSLYDRERANALAEEKAHQLLVEQQAECERAEKEAFERARKEAEERVVKEAAERARNGAEERAAREAAEQAREEGKAREEKIRQAAEARERELMALLEKERAEREVLEKKSRLQREKEERERDCNVQQDSSVTREVQLLKKKAVRERKHSDAIEQDRTCRTTNFDDPRLTVGNIVEFGRYRQGNNRSIKPVEWIVLAEEHGRYLLISRYGLDAKPYNNEYVNITWENCTLRQWLNNEFLNRTLTAEERTKIVQTCNPNPKNAKCDTLGGNVTDDQVFLLSIDEAQQYFKNDKERQCHLTEYAKSKTVLSSSSSKGWWWLRSPGYSNGDAAIVNIRGNISAGGSIVNSGGGCVRPALWVSNL